MFTITTVSRICHFPFCYVHIHGGGRKTARMVVEIANNSRKGMFNSISRNNPCSKGKTECYRCSAKCLQRRVP